MEQLKKINLCLVLIIPVFASIYYALQMPVSYDEAWTFLNFTRKGFVITMTSYDDPNNHVFHSLITNLTKFIPNCTNLIKIRISSIFFNFLFLLLFYKFTKETFGTNFALIAVGLTSVLFMNIYYSYMSRGYGIVNLCFIISLFSVFNIIKNTNAKKKWLLFCVSSIIGFATIPAYLYPFATLNFIVLIAHFKNIKNQFLANFVVIIFVILFYLPIIMQNGLSALTNNIYVQPIGFFKTIKSLPRYYFQVLTEITGIHFVIIVFLLSISCFKIYKSENKNHIYFGVIMIFAPIILMGIHRVIPFVRVFNYYGIIIVLLMILPFQKIIIKLKSAYILMLIIVFQCIMLFNFDNKINAHEEKDLAINITSHKIIEQIIGNKKYLFNQSLLATNLEFELDSQGFNNYKIIEINATKMNADAIKNYDFVIIKLENDKTKILKPLVKTNYYNVYKIK